MAETMNRLADRYESRRGDQPLSLPKIPDVRLALNVAACDNLPLVVAIGADAKSQGELERRLAKPAWDAKFTGRFVYTASHDPRDLEFVSGLTIKSGVAVVQPGQFGLQ